MHRGEKISSGQAISDGKMYGQMERRMDWHTDHYSAPAERGGGNETLHESVQTRTVHGLKTEP